MCNHVIVDLFPEIKDLSSPFEWKFASAPFDPHDFYTYFYRNNKLLRSIKTSPLPTGIHRRVVCKPSLTFIYNKDGEIIGERVATVDIPLFYTEKFYSCAHMQM
jgi:hypothetical protein